MKTKKCLILIVFSLLSIHSIAADTLNRNEWTIFCKPTINLNKRDFSGINYTTCFNTLSISAELNYTKAVRNKLLLTGGMGIGYRKYKFSILSYFNDLTPYVTGGPLQINNAIYALRFSLGTGYRVQISKRLMSEVRVAEAAEFPLTSIDVAHDRRVLTSGHRYERNGVLGKHQDQGIAMELMDVVCILAEYKLKSNKIIETVYGGIQLQANSLFAPQNGNNIFVADYYQNNTQLIGSDYFLSRGKSISLLVGFRL